MNIPNRVELFIAFLVLAFWSLAYPKLGTKVAILFMKNRDTELAKKIDELHK